ncbi:putative toxin-antitoxin system toxin component, PIN family [Candidatus Woesearchaeota archaeon]|nr:putative toxin-antitoxin system toxin component, PIN family [Candidatus Woesearchaeota archaeon]
MKIVADTNLLIASIFWSGAPYKVVLQAVDGKLKIITSQHILNEVRKVLQDPKEGFQLSEQEIDDIINGILLYAEIVNTDARIDVVRDPKDNHIITCAMAAKAVYIITRDKDLLSLKEYAEIKIITPEEFMAIFKLSD